MTCVVLIRTATATATAPPRLRIGDRHGHAVLLRGSKVLNAFVDRPDHQTVQVSVAPVAAGIGFGSYTWQAETLWTDHDSCPAGCQDVAPARALPTTVELLAQPRCFGAASHDPRYRCENPLLRTAVLPTPADALITPNAACTPDHRQRLVPVCVFGVAAAQARDTVALIGDSHAAYWRGALEVAAHARRWHGLSVTHSSCPFTRAQPPLSTPKLDRDLPRTGAIASASG